jgi:antagonist of KipI
MAILVKEPGFATSVQDLGRHGYAHLGISPAGAADSLSLRMANLLVGNQDNAAGLEMTLIGATLQFEEFAMIAVTGAKCEIEVDGQLTSPGYPIQVQAGSIVKCGRMIRGARAYLAVRGGIDLPLVMGSASTFLSAKIGGFEGRLLRKDDRLHVGKGCMSAPRALRDRKPLPQLAEGETILRATRGSQQDWFDSEAFANFFSRSFLVSHQSGRTGLRLKGHQIVPRNTVPLLTDGIPLGAIQIPPDGQPIILFVDQQTTGGYPKIANVIAADLHLVGQLRARDTIRFCEVSIEQAVGLLRQQEFWLKEIFTDGD